jgi:DNA-binding HxlR family transcriptional regulator
MAVELEEGLRTMPDVFSVNCPTREILDLISDKWSTLIITLLHESPKRFSELQRRIEGISQKMLTQNLRNLERSGLVTRTVYPQVPPKVEYNLTELGETLYEPISAVQRWAETYILDVQSAQHDYDHRVQYVTK